MQKNSQPSCADCSISGSEKACLTQGGKGSRGCPTLLGKKSIQLAGKEYKKKELNIFARQASIQEGECYAGRDQKPYVLHPVKPRIQEIWEFAQKMEYTRLGLVFCIGLAKEAAIVSDILKNHGFEVVSVVCKVGSVPKETIGVKDSEKVFIGEHESMCNPVLQAIIVNDAHTEFDILLGLCVGHDSMFLKYGKAPATVLAVKDRVTGHNPLACIYISGNYYSWLNNT